MFTFIFKFGDLSGDGHSQTAQQVYETNLSSIGAVREALKRSEAMSPALALDVVCDSYEENYINPKRADERQRHRKRGAFSLEDSYKAYQEIGDIPGFDPDYIGEYEFFALFEFHVKRGGGEGTICEQVQLPSISDHVGYGVFIQ